MGAIGGTRQVKPDLAAETIGDKIHANGLGQPPRMYYLGRGRPVTPNLGEEAITLQ
jgi:hypothetical protein